MVNSQPLDGIVNPEPDVEGHGSLVEENPIVEDDDTEGHALHRPVDGAGKPLDR